MKYIIKMVSVSLVGISLISSNIVTVEASSLSDKKKNINSSIESTKDKIETVDSEIKVTQADLDKLDKKVLESQAKLDKIKEKLAKVEAQLEASEVKLEETQKEKEEKYEIFKKRLRVMYEYGDMAYVDVLLGSNSVADLVTRMEYVNTIAKSDRELVDELEAVEIEIQKQIVKIEEERLEVDKLRKEAQTETNNLKKASDEKEAEVKKLQSTKAGYEKQMSELEAASNSIEAQIKAAEAAARKKAAEEEAARKAAAAAGNSSSASSDSTSSTIAAPKYTGGKFTRPCNGSVTSNFGYRIHPIFGTKKLHKGIDFGVATGSPIFAAEDGVVISSGWQSGYGNTVVISHGGGVSTLYAHNSSLSVSSGQRVTRGQQIARAGSTGNSTGPHCHFEVRVNGSVTNPAPYLQ